jgi:hypothetical protein
VAAFGSKSGDGAQGRAMLYDGPREVSRLTKCARKFGRMRNLLLNSAKTGGDHGKEARKQRDGVSRKHMEVNMEITCGVATVQAIFVNIPF